MRKSRYTKEMLLSALEGAESIKDVISNLGLNVNSGNYRVVKWYYIRNGLDLPVFDVSAGAKRLVANNTLTDSEWFSQGDIRGGPGSRKRLVALGVKDSCSVCGIPPIWNEVKLTLQVDHIDGDRFNNSVSNLRIICPNCHSQTKTYSNNGRRKANKYCECGTKITRQAFRCRPCASSSSVLKQRPLGSKGKIKWVEIDDLVSLVKDTNFSRAARSLGCSDNAIRKHLLRNGINPKTLDRIDTTG